MIFQVKEKRVALKVVFCALPKRTQNRGVSVGATKFLCETELPLETETLLGLLELPSDQEPD